MKANRRRTGVTTRGLFNADHGVGKGDKPRTNTTSPEYQQNLSEVFGPEHKAQRFFKKYGDAGITPGN